MKKRTNIIFVERIFPHYRKAVYDLIYKQKEFTFLHGLAKKSGIKQTTAKYSSLIRSIRYGPSESQVFLFSFWRLLLERPGIVVHEFSAGILSKPLVFLFCRLTKARLIFWGHMYDRSKGFCTRSRLSDRYRFWLWQKADSLVTYSQAEKQLLIDNGIPPEKIFVAFNTVDTATFLKIRDELEKTGKAEIKRQLQFTHDFNLTFIARLYKDKRPELLLELLSALKQRGFNSVAIHFVGDGEMLSSLKRRSMEFGLDGDVFFHGAIYNEAETGKILFCSDLMIIPGFVGLSVNHAFCFNCPVVTFKQVELDPPHSPEVEYIIDRKTGFLVTDHSTDALVHAVVTYLNSPGLRIEMIAEIRHIIENVCSLQKMAGGVVDAIDYNSKSLR